MSETIDSIRYPTLIRMGGSKLQDLPGTVLDLLNFLGGGLRSVAPVIGILIVFQLVVLRQPLENWREIAIGLEQSRMSPTSDTASPTKVMAKTNFSVSSLSVPCGPRLSLRNAYSPARPAMHPR